MFYRVTLFSLMTCGCKCKIEFVSHPLEFVKTKPSCSSLGLGFVKTNSHVVSLGLEFANFESLVLRCRLAFEIKLGRIGPEH